ncbi:MAG: nucleotidyltransferase family protein [Acidimicrobiales bacterium]|nr:nucleotidyltransferase family protein [Hyphomonadaceae bacterium]RZV44606.1 MAG: nucleotidyltransferase family protein [Acidimicrobiales bacterium]
MVMAAGHGTRMRPLTDNTCKALVEVGGKALIDHMLDRLHEAGITKAVVNVHAFADQLEAHLNSRVGGPEIIISDEREELLETGGGLIKALPLLGRAPILICNIDAVWTEDRSELETLISVWNAQKMDELFLLAGLDETLGYAGAGDFNMDVRMNLSRRDGDHAPYVYAGVQIMKPELAKGYKLEKFSRNKIWDESLKRQKAYGHVMQGFWMHVGDPNTRDEAEAILKEHG